MKTTSVQMCLDFCPTLRELVSTRQAVGRSGKPFPLLGGLSTPNNLLVIRRLFMELKPLRTLEVGMACGGSALTFAVSHRDAGSAPNGQHVAIDAWQSSGFDDVGRLQLEKAGLAGYVDVREDLSCYELARIAQSGQRFGMVYIDGSHRFEDVFVDFYFVRTLTEVGGYVLFDDSPDADVRKVVQFIQCNLGGIFEQIPIHKYRPGGAWETLKVRVGENLHRTQLTIFRKVADGDRPGNQHVRPF